MYRAACVAFLSLAFLWSLPAALYPQQKRLAPRPDPAAQLLDYYRKYPDRYIRISEESWKLDPATQIHGQLSAVHSLILKNVARATYHAIEVRFSYQTLSGKELFARTTRIEGELGPLATRQFKIRVAGVPQSAEKVVSSIVKAELY